MINITKEVWDALADEQRWEALQRIERQRDAAEAAISIELQRRGRDAADALRQARRTVEKFGDHSYAAQCVATIRGDA